MKTSDCECLLKQLDNLSIQFAAQIETLKAQVVALSKREQMVQPVKQKEIKKQMLTAEEAARYLSVSLGSLYNMVNRKRIRYYKPNRCLRFNVKDLDNWLQSACYMSDSEIDNEINMLANG